MKLDSVVTWMQRFQGHQFRPPNAKLSAVILQLSSDILQTLCDGCLTCCTAITHNGHEELFHAWHLSPYSPQLVKG